MSKNLRKCMKKMHFFCESDSKHTKTVILNEMCKDECFFDALFEIVKNIQCQCLKIPTSKRKLLKAKHIKLMDKIYKRPKSKTIRRKLVKQSGGFLPFLLPILTPIIVELIQNAISKKSNSGTT